MCGDGGVVYVVYVVETLIYFATPGCAWEIEVLLYYPTAMMKTMRMMTSRLSFEIWFCTFVLRRIWRERKGIAILRLLEYVVHK